MADDFDMRFHEETSGSYILPNMRMLSFESETSHNSINVNPTMTGYVNMESLGSISVSNVSGLHRAPGVDDDIGPISHVGSSSINSWADPVADIHEESGLTPEWTVEEELILKQGLIDCIACDRHGIQEFKNIEFAVVDSKIGDCEELLFDMDINPNGSVVVLSNLFHHQSAKKKASSSYVRLKRGTSRREDGMFESIVLPSCFWICCWNFFRLRARLERSTTEDTTKTPSV